MWIIERFGLIKICFLLTCTALPDVGEAYCDCDTFWQMQIDCCLSQSTKFLKYQYLSSYTFIYTKSKWFQRYVHCFRDRYEPPLPHSDMYFHSEFIVSGVGMNHHYHTVTCTFTVHPLFQG